MLGILGVKADGLVDRGRRHVLVHHDNVLVSDSVYTPGLD